MEPIPKSEIDLVEYADYRDQSRDEEILINEWCAEQLHRLGLPPSLAEKFAGLVDWHEFARLVERGCPPRLALEIVR